MTGNVATAKVLVPPKPPNIQTATDAPTYVKALIYGDPGAGKTYLACTGPKTLVLLTESAVSIPTIKKVQLDKGIKIDFWPINEIEDMEEAFDYVAGGNHPYQTVALDSLSDFYRRLMHHIVSSAASRRSTHDPDIPEQGDWQRLQNKILHTARLFRDLDMHVVFTTRVMDIRSEMKFVPFIQPKGLAQELPAFCNLVGYLGVEEREKQFIRRLLVQPTDQYIAKNPGGLLPPVVENPDLTEMFALVSGK